MPTIRQVTGLQAALDAKGLLPLNTRICFIGDSQTGFGYGVNGNSYQYQNYGFTTWAQQINGYRFYLPKNGNLGVSGNTTTQMVARLGSIAPLDPKVVVVLGGTNDLLASATVATITANLRTIYNAALGLGAKVIAITILPRYGAGALTSPNETNRGLVNAWIKSQTDIITIDAESYFPSSSYFESDGLHPNPLGAYTLGNLVATQLGLLIQTGNVSKAITIDNSYSPNPEMAGTSGGKGTGVTGSVATSWNISSQSSAGGATIVGSKVTDANGNDSQVIDISGTYTGNSKNVQLYYTTSSPSVVPAIGTLIEAIADVEITGALSANISSVYASVKMQTGDFVTTLAEGVSMYFTSSGTLNMPVGRYTLRTPPVTVGTGIIGVITVTLFITLKNTATTDAVSGQVKIYRLGCRNVPTSLEPIANTILPQVLLGKQSRREVADVATTITALDRTISYTSLTATRAVTLPTAASVPNQSFTIRDEAGAAGTYSITIVGTVNGVTNPTAITKNYGTYTIYSNGVVWFAGGAEITDASVTYSKIQNIVTNKLLGRYTAGSGVMQEITISTGLSLDSSGNLTATASAGNMTTGKVIALSNSRALL